MSPELYDELLPLFAQVANDVRRQNPLIDREDFVQECALWAIEHPAKLKEYRDDEDEKRGDRMLYGALRNACRQYARKDKAQRLGYDPDDEMFYTVGVLTGGKYSKGLLHEVYEDESWLPKGGAYSEAPSRVADPAHGNNWVTTLSDVSAAVGRLSKSDRELIELKYRDGLTERDLAARLGVADATAHRWLDKAVRLVHKELGGPRPHVDPPEEYVGDRRVLSNEHARAITKDNHDAA